MLPAEDNSPYHYQCDIQDVLGSDEPHWDLMIAHPPCTYLTVTGNKWFLPQYADRFPDRPRHREEAIKFFMALVNAPIQRICVENPVGVMSRHYRKPDQIIQPYQFGHPEPKKTCLWLKGLPPLAPTRLVEPEYFTSKSGKRLPKWFFIPSPSHERQKLRNRTFEGIASAMASQWGDNDKINHSPNQMTLDDFIKSE